MLVSIRTIVGLVAAGLMLGAGLGCTAISTAPGGMFSSAAPEAAPAPVGTAVIELRETNKKPKIMEMPVHDSTHVQDAVVYSKALRKFRRVNASVIRTSPEGRRHKMDCDYDVANRQIQPEFDYALQPGDHVVISEDETTIFDDMFKSLTGPIGRMSGGHAGHGH